MFKGIDFYSDTLTQPTPQMRKVISEAVVGDEQKGEDPTTLALEEKVALLLGHEAAQFFPSASMANEVALKILSNPGDEILAYNQCHLFFAETGGPAIHAGLMTRGIVTETGIFTSEDVVKNFRTSKGPHYPNSTLLSIENTTNMGGGVAWKKSELIEVTNTAKNLNMKCHLDGARLWNALVKEAYKANEIGPLFDTVTVCFSKGLGCPAGAVLSFPKIYKEKVRRLKQLFGGALRQSGILTSACLYALENHLEKIREDHENAKRLGELLSTITYLNVENPVPSTNMLFFSLKNTKTSPDEFMHITEQKGLRFSKVGDNRFRAVTHLNISKNEVEKAYQLLKEISNT